MKKILKLLSVGVIVVVAMSSCKEKQPQPNQELIGRWNAVKSVWGGETYTEDLEFIYFKFNADGTCVFNIEGLRPDDDVYATYTFANNKITLIGIMEEEEYSFVVSVEKLTAAELVLNLPPMEEDDPSFTIHYVKAQ
jgi:hypothetical protein